MLVGFLGAIAKVRYIGQRDITVRNISALQCIRYWNGRPYPVISSPNLDTFKTRLGEVRF
ncbi:hypothetical protein DPMN_060000 [Dreissena polymorpha]|uniref:Uncharacterized protein n=1 Tax=Dreissena polymorpha TaxID=45954 RepID=A0A9D4C4X7_DREPO|nr:hypothetical protein DPMN_060000 [Dreissena polymorpha]